MKPITLALSSALLASAATTGFHALFLRQQPANEPHAAERQVAAATAAKTMTENAQPAQLAGREQELLARIAELERSFARLDENASIGAARSAAPTEAPLAAATAPELMREVAHQVIAEKEAAEKADQLAAEIQREKERAQRRAEQIAKELGLSTGDQEQLALVYEGESAKRRELFSKLGFDEAMRGRDFGAFTPETRDQVRDGFKAIREWRDGELVTRLGSSVADQIANMEPRGRNRDWGGFGGGGPAGGFGGFGGGGGPGGPGGQAGGAKGGG